MATERQRAYLAKLIDARRTALGSNAEMLERIKSVMPESVHWSQVSKVIKELENLPVDQREDIDVDTVRPVLDSIKDGWLRVTAKDIISKFDRGALLSDKQRGVLQKAYINATTEPLQEGMYKIDDTYYKVMKGRNGSLVAKKLVVRYNLPHSYCEFVYSKDVLDKLTVDMKLSEEDARAFGHKFKVCCNCGDPIGYGDKRGTLMSYAVGYGPVCANNNGWHYPRNIHEAVAICKRLGLTHPLLTILEQGFSIEEAEQQLTNNNKGMTQNEYL